MRGKLTSLCALVFLLLAQLTWAQGVKTGAITGVVKDPSGAVIAKATVEVINQQSGVTERSTTTATDGIFAATLLPPGAYRVKVTTPGFAAYEASNVMVRLNEITRADVTLQVGATKETIIVSAENTLVNTESATTGQPVDSHTLTTLPLPVPNFLFLLSLSPGAAGEPPDVRGANRGIVDINVNGQRTTNNSVSLEGINVNDFNLAHFDTIPLPNPDAIAEFKVATSLYDASSGTKGGGALGLVLKTGSQDLHWKAYWNHRNDFLNANEWFLNHTNTKRPKLLQNVLGFSGSGPAWGIGGFWFFNIQGVRARNGLDPNGSVASATIPSFPIGSDGTTSAAMLATAYGLTPAQIDPVAVNILNLKNSYYGGTYLIPRPGQTGCGALKAASGANSPATFRCNFSKVTPVVDTQHTATYDRPLLSGRDKLSVRWFYDNGHSAKPFGTASNLAFPRADVQNNRFVSISELHQISPRQINEFRFGFSRFISAAGNPTDIVSLKDIGASRPNGDTVPGIYRFSITGLFTLGTGVNDDRNTTSNQFYWADTWSMSKGRHNLRAGYELVRYQLNRTNRFAIRGSLNFEGSTGLNPWQDFVSGTITSLQSGAGDPQRYFRATDMASFFQDDWKITDRLKLNLGLRWDGMAFSHDLKLRTANFLGERAKAGLNPYVFPSDLNDSGLIGTPGFGSCALPTCFTTHNFGPRIGFAYDLFANHKTVLRGGYGVFYQRLSNQNVLQGSLGAPFFVQLVDSRSTPPSLQLANPITSQPATTTIATAFIPQISTFVGLDPGKSQDINNPAAHLLYKNQAGQYCSGFAPSGAAIATNCAINLASFSSVLPGTHPPYNQQWSLGVQHDFGRGWATELDYVGSHYVGGLGIYDPYLAPLASAANPITVKDAAGNSYVITTNTSANEPLRHLAPGISRAKGARVDGNIGFALYDALQLTVSHRFQNGLYFQSAYTWSKTIDNVSGSQSTDELNATNSAAQLGANMLDLAGFNPALQRSLGDFDRRHRLVISYSYDLPVPKHGIWGTQVFQGWTISGITAFQNGLPFTVFSGNGGKAYGSLNTSPLLVCSNAVKTLPNCTAGATTTPLQAVFGGSVQSHIDNFINPNFFSQDAKIGAGDTGVGNTPRNSFRGPFQQTHDFSVAKTFRLAESHSLVFRTDFFNIFNHPVFGQPTSLDITSPSTFGQITTTAAPARIIQFGLKYEH